MNPKPLWKTLGAFVVLAALALALGCRTPAGQAIAIAVCKEACIAKQLTQEDLCDGDLDNVVTPPEANDPGAGYYALCITNAANATPRCSALCDEIPLRDGHDVEPEFPPGVIPIPTGPPPPSVEGGVTTGADEFRGEDVLSVRGVGGAHEANHEALDVCVELAGHLPLGPRLVHGSVPGDEVRRSLLHVVLPSPVGVAHPADLVNSWETIFTEREKVIVTPG